MFSEGEDRGNWLGDGKLWHSSESQGDLVAEYVEPAPVKSPEMAEAWPKWYRVGEEQIAEFPREGVSTNYHIDGRKSAGMEFCYYAWYVPRSWQRITAGEAANIVASWKAATRKVVLKEWICWDYQGEEHVRWQSYDPATQGGTFESCYLFSHPTGNERTVEIPITNQG
jgi:hypothetical protein